MGLIFILHPDFPRGSKDLYLILGLTLLVFVDTLVLWLKVDQDRDAFAQAMTWVLGPDLLAVTGFTYLLYDVESGFFPVAVLLPVVYALIMPKREAWIAGMGSCLAYLVGHALAHREILGISGMVIHLLAAASIPLVTSMVATSVERRRQREEETVIAVGEREVMLDQINRRVAELQAVSQITELVHSSLDFDQVAPRVLDILAKVLGVDACCLFVIDKERSETLFSASVGTVDGVEIGRAAMGRYEDPGGHFACTAAFDHAEMMVLFCAPAPDIDGLSEEDRLVLGAVASELAVAAENSRLYKLTKKLAITDDLTGLANYRHLQARLEEELIRSQRYGKQFSLLMLDVDDFKLFNDSQGHIAGDSALSELARVLESAVREVDLVARYGGEEFSVVLPETDAAGAYVVAEKVREAVSIAEFTGADGSTNLHLTVSVGLATFPDHGGDRESILREADDALYRAKSGGKNRVRTPRARVGDGDSASRETPEALALMMDEWTGD